MAKKRKTKTRRKKSNPKRNKKNSKESMWKKITVLASSVAALDNITGHDNAMTTGMPVADRAKGFINSLVGRVTGFNPISDSVVQVPQQLSLNGMFNKYTGIGFASLIYSMIPIKKLPYKGKAGSFGKKMAAAGAISGIFKTPEGSHSSGSHRVMPALTVRKHSQVVTTQ